MTMSQLTKACDAVAHLSLNPFEESWPDQMKNRLSSPNKITPLES
jgi:hypothetical protein